MSDPVLKSKALGLMYGLLAGEVLGSAVEGLEQDEREERLRFDLSEMLLQNPWQTLSGQPTDSGELAVLLCRLLAHYGEYQEEGAWQAYEYWLRTEPFAVPDELKRALLSQQDEESCATTALARVAPMALMVPYQSLPQLAAWAMADTALTHPNMLCQQVSGLYVMALGHVLENDCSADQLYQLIKDWASQLKVDKRIIRTIDHALFMPPTEAEMSDLSVLGCFQNAIWQLLYAQDYLDGMLDTLKRGGDTANNAAVAGALLGACYGVAEVPDSLRNAITHCRPLKGQFGVLQPRPECCWANEVEYLAEQILTGIKKPA
ncbi:ADP-ribosylglycohydrolase family protein [uncultured Rheinheimera sp.]|uniref:ADP-ribosylglycohydrolase family protein n=1 Tax=uncultured Rheinheimera sp. TaxID=400532 RepID=UPI0025948ED9|nr:ADP-ribosylglycohydrolase family protein [uncultured Rheinheimera sp.]